VVIGNGLQADDVRLEATRALSARGAEFFYRRTLTTSPVNRILRSQREPRLIVVEKDATRRRRRDQLRRRFRASVSSPPFRRT
jgi:hypothetical protein